MQDPQIGRISNFIWSVADDVLRDLYQRGKYRDVILPMTVLRRLERSRQYVCKRDQAATFSGVGSTTIPSL